MNTKLYLTLNLVLLLFTLEVSAQDLSMPKSLKDTSYWSSDLNMGLNFNQAAFSGNWKSGGVNSIAWGAVINGKANYSKGKYSWDNHLEMIYGLVKNEGQETRKSNDRIFLDSKVGYKVSDHWSYFGSVNFITQFTDGFDYSGPEKKVISGFFSPAFLTTGIGMEYKPNEAFSLRIAPFSPRFTFVANESIAINVPNNYGVPIGQKVRTEWLAFQLFATYNKKLSENLSLSSRYFMYANYQNLAFKDIDHRLDFMLIAKITKFVDVTFTSINLYDRDMDSKIQYSQALALGIIYKVSNKK